MATVIERKTDEETGRELLVYESGLIKDAETGYIVKPPPHVMITKENTNEYHRARKEQARAVALAAANEKVNDPALVEKYGDLAYIAKITGSAMDKATTKSDPKAIEAARFIGSMTGDFGEDVIEEKGVGGTDLQKVIGEIVKGLKVEVHLHEAKKD